MSIKRRVDFQNGFTLIETLVIILVFSVLTVAFARVIGFNFASVHLVGEKNKATALAQGELDRVIAVILDYLEDPELDSPDKVRDKLAEEPGFVDSAHELFEQVNQPVVFHVQPVAPVISYDGTTTLSGYHITVVGFYGNGRHHVKFEYFLEGKKG